MTFNPDLPTADLVALALTIDPCADWQDEEPYWDIVRHLQERGTRDVLEQAMQLCADERSDGRCLGVNILGQLGLPTRTFPAEAMTRLVKLLQSESDMRVLRLTALALGHYDDARKNAPLLALKNHPDADFRYCVVFGLLGQKEPLVIEAMIEFLEDPSDLVRDWAITGIDSAEQDTPAIREALLRRLTDEDSVVRNNAIALLATFGEERILPTLIDKLTLEPAGFIMLDAAQKLGRAELCPVLQRLRDEQGEEDCDPALLEAIAACCAT
jgi:HEAT repeat protein